MITPLVLDLATPVKNSMTISTALYCIENIKPVYVTPDLSDLHIVDGYDYQWQALESIDLNKLGSVKHSELRKMVFTITGTILTLSMVLTLVNL